MCQYCIWLVKQTSLKTGCYFLHDTTWVHVVTGRSNSCVHSPKESFLTVSFFSAEDKHSNWRWQALLLPPLHMCSGHRKHPQSVQRLSRHHSENASSPVWTLVIRITVEPVVLNSLLLSLLTPHRVEEYIIEMSVPSVCLPWLFNPRADWNQVWVSFLPRFFGTICVLYFDVPLLYHSTKPSGYLFP